MKIERDIERRITASAAEVYGALARIYDLQYDGSEAIRFENGEADDEETVVLIVTHKGEQEL